jgi:hypothetical protein
MRTRTRLALTAVMLAAGAWSPSVADATYFQADFTGPGYPATQDVSGLSGGITDLDVTVRGIQAANGDALALLLQAPSGQALILMNGGPGEIGFADITFDDSAAGQIPSGMDLGSVAMGNGYYTFKPTDYYADDDFPAPGPGTNYNNPGPDGGGKATLRSTFGGIDPNGTWKLFALNFGSDPIFIRGPWVLQLSGFEGFTLGKPIIAKNLKRATIPVTFAGPGRPLIDDASHPFYRAAKKKKAKPNLKPPGTLITPNANYFVHSAGTLDLPVLPSSKAKRILARRGKVTLPVRVTFGTFSPNQQTSKTINITLRKKRSTK